MPESKKEIAGDDLSRLRECLEILNAVAVLEYHNKNWIAYAINKNPGLANREKRRLLEDAIRITGTTSRGEHV